MEITHTHRMPPRHTSTGKRETAEDGSVAFVVGVGVGVGYCWRKDVLLTLALCI